MLVFFQNDPLGLLAPDLLGDVVSCRRELLVQLKLQFRLAVFKFLFLLQEGEFPLPRSFQLRFGVGRVFLKQAQLLLIICCDLLFQLLLQLGFNPSFFRQQLSLQLLLLGAQLVIKLLFFGL